MREQAMPALRSRKNAVFGMLHESPQIMPPQSVGRTSSSSSAEYNAENQNKSIYSGDQTAVIADSAGKPIAHANQHLCKNRKINGHADGTAHTRNILIFRCEFLQGMNCREPQMGTLKKHHCVALCCLENNLVPYKEKYRHFLKRLNRGCLARSGYWRKCL